MDPNASAPVGKKSVLTKHLFSLTKYRQLRSVSMRKTEGKATEAALLTHSVSDLSSTGFLRNKLHKLRTVIILENRLRPL